ncbi:MAG: hypothetical protein KBG15_08475 [Kofleriaceae bacterium]|nr:hypothetical protein [Kofleriaceae bacterium]
MLEYPYFHDLPLKEIIIDWRLKSIRLLIAKYPSEPVEIVASKFSQFQCSSLESWGPSRSIYFCTVDLKKMVLEMQSGDTIEITAEDFAFPNDAVPSPPTKE